MHSKKNGLKISKKNFYANLMQIFMQEFFLNKRKRLNKEQIIWSGLDSLGAWTAGLLGNPGEMMNFICEKISDHMELN